jgi:hypothetical protein
MAARTFSQVPQSLEDVMHTSHSLQTIELDHPIPFKGDGEFMLRFHQEPLIHDPRLEAEIDDPPIRLDEAAAMSEILHRDAVAPREAMVAHR